MLRPCRLATYNPTLTRQTDSVTPHSLTHVSLPLVVQHSRSFYWFTQRGSIAANVLACQEHGRRTRSLPWHFDEGEMQKNTLALLTQRSVLKNQVFKITQAHSTTDVPHYHMVV